MQTWRRGLKRVRGFFAFAETTPYQPRGVLLGQQTSDSCVPACCRMLLLDHFPSLHADYQFSESFLRTALGTDIEVTYISNIPRLFQQVGFSMPYMFSASVTVEQLIEAITNAPIIVRVTIEGDEQGHVVIVEEIKDDRVAIRDPLPEGSGSAYRISWQTFCAAWQARKTGLGQAVL